APIRCSNLFSHLGVSAGGLLVGASLWLISATTPFPGPWTLLPVIGTALIIVFTPHVRTINRALSTPTMVRVGDLSYSIYLWHWPLIVFAASIFPNKGYALVTAALLSFLPALASYHWL